MHAYVCMRVHVCVCVCVYVCVRVCVCVHVNELPFLMLPTVCIADDFLVSSSPN